jgi:hypothetical protein
MTPMQNPDDQRTAFRPEDATDDLPQIGARDSLASGALGVPPEQPPSDAIRGMLFHDYPAVARSLYLNLTEFCDESEPYPAMVAHAGQRAAAEILRLRASLAAVAQKLDVAPESVLEELDGLVTVADDQKQVIANLERALAAVSEERDRLEKDHRLWALDNVARLPKRRECQCYRDDCVDCAKEIGRRIGHVEAGARESHEDAMRMLREFIAESRAALPVVEEPSDG